MTSVLLVILACIASANASRPSTPADVHPPWQGLAPFGASRAAAGGRDQSLGSAARELLARALGPGRPAAPAPAGATSRRAALLQELPRAQSMGLAAVAVEALCRVGESDFDSFVQSPLPLLALSRSGQQPSAAGEGISATGRNATDGVFHQPGIDPGLFVGINEVPWQQWTVLACSTIVFFVIEIFGISRLGDSVAVHIFALLIWIAFAVLYAFYIGFAMDAQSSFDWVTGYALEWMLSVDNLFVFHIIFSSYKVPAPQIRKALFIGIVGAVLIRLVFFFALAELLQVFQWARVPFGALLIWSGIETARADDEDEESDLEDSRLVRLLRACLGSRIHSGYDEDGHGLFMFSVDGRLQVTMLFVVVTCLELSDVLFAVDSVTAKVAQIPNQYLALSSCMLAMFGLRSAFFIISDLIHLFSMLKYGLCVILVFIGIELILAPWIQLASSTVCVMILSVFMVSILGSIGLQAKLLRTSSADGKAFEDDPSAGEKAFEDPSKTT